MNISHDSEPPVVELRGACLKHTHDYDAGLEEVDLKLFAGDLALVRIESGIERHPLPDVISGLIPPDRGEAFFCGASWLSMPADNHAAARGKIGRVFGDHGWVSNLDVDENVTLAARYHGAMTDDQLARALDEWCDIAGLASLPQTRPAATDRALLARAQWVRASLTSPRLLVLEFPGRHLAGAWRVDLLKLVNRLRESGTAVLWLCESDQEWNDASLKPSLKLTSERNRLLLERDA
jgi:ribose transport system ATP-binding protein